MMKVNLYDLKVEKEERESGAFSLSGSLEIKDDYHMLKRILLG